MTDIKKEGREKKFSGFIMLTRMNYYAAENAKILAREIEVVKPDLILYDITCLYLRPTLEYYEKWHTISQNTNVSERSTLEFNPSRKLPPMVVINPSFAIDHATYPNKIEAKLFIPPIFTWDFFVGMIFYLIAHFYKCFKLGFGFRMPFKNILPGPLPNTKFMLVTVFPELQARSHMFDNNFYKFVGSTIDESVKNEFSLKNTDVLSEIFDKFKDRETKINILEEKEQLVYVSLGSTFNNNIDVYKIIVDGIKSFNLGSNRHNIKLDNLTVVVSTGDVVYNKFTELINKNEYLLPSNILLVKSVPQTEILKKATLFVTHCGQNSVSESVHCGGKSYILYY